MSAFDLDFSSLALEKEATTAQSDLAEKEKKPICVLVIGMAGSGKTSLMQRLNLEMLERGNRAYYVNLDPATTSATGQ